VNEWRIGWCTGSRTTATTAATTLLWIVVWHIAKNTDQHQFGSALQIVQDYSRGLRRWSCDVLVRHSRIPVHASPILARSRGWG
jgi:hypothetical protein